MTLVAIDVAAANTYWNLEELKKNINRLIRIRFMEWLGLYHSWIKYEMMKLKKKGSGILFIGVQPVVSISVGLVESIVFVLFSVITTGPDAGRTASAWLVESAGGRHAFVGWWRRQAGSATRTDTARNGPRSSNGAAPAIILAAPARMLVQHVLERVGIAALVATMPVSREVRHGPTFARRPLRRLRRRRIGSDPSAVSKRIEMRSKWKLAIGKLFK